jgi:hypothetical protein
MERRRAFEAVTAFLRGLAARSPVLLVVDDLQYAGQSTVELLHYLGRHVPGSRLLTVATVRAENDAELGAALAPVARRVEVGPLGPEAVRQLASAAGQGGLADTILRRTGGHTFFVVESLRALAGGDEGLPESLVSAVQARVRRTGPAAETLLRVAAVLGATVDPLALSALLDLTPAAALERCEVALGRAAARHQRPRLRVRQRPHPRGTVREHAGAGAAGVSPPGRRPADRAAGVAGTACSGRGRLAPGGTGLAPGRRRRHAPVRGDRRGDAGHPGTRRRGACR